MSEAGIQFLKTSEQISLYQPKQQGLIFPKTPTFATHQEARKYRKEHLVAACREFARQGLDYGFAGHLTVRDPEHPHLYWTNPMAVHFAKVKISNLILVDHEGRVVEGQYAVNQAGFVLHAAVHEKHPDIVAVCHAHTLFGTTFSTLGKKIEPITQDAAAFYEDHVVVLEDAGKVAVEVDAGHKVASALNGARAIIHQNHGLFTVSRHSIDAAAFWFTALERCCQQQLLIYSTGMKPKPVDSEHSHYSREHVGSEYIGWLHFQPIYEYLTQSQPDLFD
jgi:ribulose-5-phosphate 4-epimerase/fuculose-1-phosphate aldolase